MAEYTLTIYEPDDTTPMVEFGTAVDHPRPWLHLPEVFGEAEISLLEGTSRIGRMNLRVIDPQTGATKADRGLTALLGNSEGYSVFNGRRAVFRMVDPAVTILDGMVAGVRLETLAGFTIQLDDIRARGIKLPVFTHGGTVTVLPRGVLLGYGEVPGGGYMSPPTSPLQARYHSWEPEQGLIYFEPARAQYHERIVTSDLLQATRISWDQEQQRLIYPDIEVWWRPIGSDTWLVHRRMPTPIYTPGVSPIEVLHYGADLIFTIPSTFVDPYRGQQGIRFVHQIFLRATADQPDLPAHGAHIEVMLVYVGPPSERFPWHFEGTAGELLRNVLRGDYSSDEQGNPIDPRIRYDEDHFVGESAPAALRMPVRLRITETEDDLREWFERACKSLGIAPALNGQGEISPVSGQLPDESVSLPEINDSNAQPIPGWEHPTDDAINRVEIEYYRDFRVPEENDPLAERSSADGISSVKQIIPVDPLDPTIQQTIGVKPLKVDGFLFRALGGEDGQPLSGEIVDETAVQHAQRLGLDVILRWAYGGQSSFVRVSRSDPQLAGLVVGDWVIDARSWAPNYASGKRGRNHLAQVVAIKDVSPQWRELRLVDAAPHANPVAQPTVGVLSEDSPGVVSVPVIEVPEGIEARVEYAVSDTLPDTSSGLWTLLGRTSAPETLTTPILPSGSIVWVRARGQAVGRRPSAWTNAVSITLGVGAQVFRLYVRISSSGTVTVIGELGALTAGVRIYYAVHRPQVGAGTLTLFQDFAAGVGVWTLRDIRVRPGEAITVEVEPWTGWDGSAVSGDPGRRLSKTVLHAPDEEIYRIRNVVWKEGETTGELSWEVGPATDESWLGYLLLTKPVTEEKWRQVAESIMPATSPVTLPMPTESAAGAQVLLIQIESRYEDSATGELAVGDVYRKIIYPKTRIPAIDEETGELARAAINARKQFAASLPVYLPVLTEADKPVDNSEADYVLVLETGKPYRWDGSRWVTHTEVPAIAIYPALTAGIIRASHISVESLSEIKQNAGIIVSGVFRNPEGTAAIRLDANDEMPEGVVDFLDLAAEGTDPGLKFGKIRVLANGDTIIEDEVEKTAVISHWAFRPDHAGNWQSTVRNTTLDTGTTAMTFGARCPVPAGAEIVAIRFTGRLETLGNVCSLDLVKIAADGTITTLATCSISSVATDQTIQQFLPAGTTADPTAAYVFRVQLIDSSGTGAAPFFTGAEVVYKSHSYRETL